MTAPVITLTTDFGRSSPYVAVMKGVILSINPAARVVDLTHEIRPHDVRHASYFLGAAVPWFPAGTVHVCVVDPGVGSARAALYADTPDQRLVGPDNGAFTGVIRKLGCRAVGALTNPKFWRTPTPSDTFHGRDIFAAVAAHLSLGVDHRDLAPGDVAPVELQRRPAVTFGKQWSGEVQFVDDFGNLITNVPACKLKALPLRVTLGGAPLGPVRWVRTYSEAVPGELVCLFSSDGFVELAEVNGSAARRLHAETGAAIELAWD
jgi:S-adenosylmethionine hydrolase